MLSGLETRFFVFELLYSSLNYYTNACIPTYLKYSEIPLNSGYHI